MPPCLLAIDTATEALAIGLRTPQGAWCLDEPGGALASQRLLPAVAQLLHDAGVAGAALQAVAFGQGPGAFTGLRTACSVAQGLAFGWGCPVLALDSLMAVAEATGTPPGQALWVAMDARMDEVYAACYRRGTAPGQWQVLHAPALYTQPALAGRWRAEPPRAVVGTAAALAGAEALAAPGGAGRAAALLRLAEAAWNEPTRHLDPAQALPLYLRDKVALTTAERAARAA